MVADDRDTRLAEVERERDLYRRLLEVGKQRHMEAFLRETLVLLVELTGAQQGYLEVFDDADREGTPRWSVAHELTPEGVRDVRTRVSRGIIAVAVATGEIVVTNSALLDPRFSGRDSVRTDRIEAVLCAPIGRDAPRGVLYLQGRTLPGGFSEDDRARVEFVTHHLAPLVDRIAAEQRRREVEDPTALLRRTLRLDGVIGRSAGLATALRDVAIIARSAHTVMLYGETGTGKTQLARVIHDNGPRANHPFVEVNCANLSADLAENELFGAVEGGHSQAKGPIKGKVAAAEKGTLFLDDIPELSMDVQRKLLQLLESKRYTPLGGGGNAIQADVRIIAGANLDLAQAVGEGRFREDLFYRLNVFEIRIPPLAARRDDIPDLAAHFCAAAARTDALGHVELSPDAVLALQASEWPGNVRQLSHAVTVGVLRAASEGASVVERRHLFPEQRRADAGPGGPMTYEQAMRDLRTRFLREALASCDWNVVETAAKLDISKSYLYQLIKTHGLEPEQG